MRASTLFIMSSILGAMFAGITFLNWWTGITPHAGVTILAQMAREILGQSWIGSILILRFSVLNCHDSCSGGKHRFFSLSDVVL